jgi:amino acid transporter
VAQDTTAPPAALAADTFVRRSSGLVREISGRDALIANLTIFNFVIAAVTVMTLPFTFPGANLPISVILSAVPAVLVAGVYVLFGLAMPRAGGDYLYISRTIHPAIGFAANFSFAAWNMIWLGVNANWLATIGLRGFFASMTLVSSADFWTNASSDLSGKTAAFLIGTGAIALTGVSVAAGLRVALRLMKILFTLGVVGIITAIVAVFFTSRSGFNSGLADQHTSVGATITSAHAAGFTAPSSWHEFQPTILGVGLVSLATVFVYYSAFTGGEMKNVRRSLPFSIFGALAISLVIFLAMAIAAVHVWGNDFMASAYYLFYNAPDKYPLASDPTYNYLAGIGHPNAILVLVMGFGFVCTSFAALFFGLIVTTRCLFAWAFDRILPVRVAEVSPRFHSPIIATVVVACVGELSLIWYTYSAGVDFLGGTTMGYISTLITACAAAVVFPYVRKELYALSPVRPTIAGIPAISLIGALGVVVLGVMIYGFMTNDTFGANVHKGLAFFLGLWAAGLVIFVAARLIRRSQGVPFDAAFTDLPPE